jgi:hypothetical protein
MTTLTNLVFGWLTGQTVRFTNRYEFQASTVYMSFNSQNETHAHNHIHIHSTHTHIHTRAHTHTHTHTHSTHTHTHQNKTIKQKRQVHGSEKQPTPQQTIIRQIPPQHLDKDGVVNTNYTCSTTRPGYNVMTTTRSE